MKRVFNYTIVGIIAETKKSIVYRAKKENENNTVIIKVLKSEYPSSSEIARFKQENEIINSLNLEGIIKVFDIVQDENGFALVQEDF